MAYGPHANGLSDTDYAEIEAETKRRKRKLTVNSTQHERACINYFDWCAAQRRGDIGYDVTFAQWREAGNGI